MKSIDLNCDLGEGAGNDAALMPLVTSANIACGAHAGDRRTMAETVELAIRHGVKIGAHPGHDDPASFGRLERDITPAAAGRLVLRQIEELVAVAGPRLRHVKLHGALYNQVSRDLHLAEGVAEALAGAWPDLILYALSGSQLARVASARGLRVAEEAFADRTYQPDGTLTPRTQPGAVVASESAAVAQVLDLVRRGVVCATNGRLVPVTAETICLHGDAPDAVALAGRVRAALEAAGIAVRAFGA